MVASHAAARAARSDRARLIQAASVLALTAVLTGLGSTSAVAATADAADAADAGSTVEQVVVTAHKASSVEAALVEKKNDIGVTNVMSADEIAQRPGGNIVDIISHMPGLSGFSDMGLGQAATGEQEYVTIRGIDSSYNAYTLNGIRAPQADPGSRALSLKLIAPYGLQSVKVEKTPTADMDGDSIGGIIDIRTPTAFDFDGPMTRVTAEGDYSALAHKVGAKSGGGAVQGEFARRFGGAEDIGVYATAYYDQKNSVGESVESTGYVPTLASENSITDFSKVHGISTTGVRYDYYNDKIVRWGGNFSLDYQTENQTLYVQGSYGHYKVTGDDTQHSIIDGVVALYGNGTSFSPVGILPGSYYQERDETEQLGTLKIGGSTKTNRLTMEYEVSAGYAQIARPNYVEGSLYGMPNPTGYANIDLSDPSRDGVTYDSPATKAYALSQDVDHLWKYQGSDSATSNMMYTAKFDVNYKVEAGFLDSLKGGVDINISDRDQYQHQFFGNNGDNFIILGPGGVIEPLTNGAGPSVTNMPGRNLTFMDGAYAGVFKAYDRSVFENGVLPFKYTSQFGIDPATGQVVGNPGPYTQNDYMRNTVRGSEKIYSTYGMANFKFGDLQAIAGLRYEYTDFRAKTWVVDGDTGGFQANSHNYGEVLPSINLVYRWDQSLVFRGSIRKSFSRPAYGLIAAPTTISRSDFTDEIVGISQPNPNLKPAEAVNYDASVEFYRGASTILEANVYHKDITNFIYAAASAGGFPSDNIFSAPVGGVVISQPDNGKSAELTGMELDGRHSFTDELPGLWSGLGLGGSLTLQHSSADSGRPDHFGRKTWLPRAPRIIYNLDAFYEKDGLKADLSYQYTGLQLVGLTGNNLDSYLQPTKTLDLSVSYPIRGVKFTVAAKNLLNTSQFYKTLGKGKEYLGLQDGGGNGSYVETGRFLSIQASYAW